MIEKLLHFIKYNNATVIILALILILGGGALAAGPEAVGEKQTSIQGVDNTALLAVDFSSFNMDFKIENIEQDEKYYYATYSFLDLAQDDSAWQYQLSRKTQKISKKIKGDLGEYLAKFLAKHYEARIRELKVEKSRAEAQGEQRRIEVTEYSGLIGRTLDLASKVFPGYEPVVKKELPTPENFNLPVLAENSAAIPPATDNLANIYNDYVAAHDKDSDGVLDLADNCLELANADQLDSDGDGAGDVCPGTVLTPNPLGETATSTPPDSGDLPPDGAISPADPGQDGLPPDADQDLGTSEPPTVDVIELPAPEITPDVAPEPTVAPEATPEPAPAE
ncbi:MAG: hypothetical protein Q7K35_06170 [bacterium]|nr:hypothetical protein [bacterium]